MSAANPSLVYDADFEEVSNQRRSDRRGSDRRSARMHFDTLFAATLVSHVTPAGNACIGGYGAAERLRAGIAFDVRA